LSGVAKVAVSIEDVFEGLLRRKFHQCEDHLFNFVIQLRTMDMGIVSACFTGPSPPLLTLFLVRVRLWLLEGTQKRTYEIPLGEVAARPEAP